MLHSSISVGWPEQVPPFASSTSLILVFVLVPVPHVFEHVPIIQSSQTQWIATISYINIKIAACGRFLELILHVFNSKINLLIEWEIRTRTFLCITYFFYIFVANTSSTISFLDFFGSSVYSCTSSACLRTLSNLPIIPNAIYLQKINWQS